MAHLPGAEAGDADVFDMDSAAAAIGNALGNTDEEQRDDDEEGQPENEGEPDEGELEIDGDEDEEEGDEPAKPAIEAPQSLNADEKARFSQLPEEAQRLLSDVEARRNDQVRQATTKASEAQRTAEAAAAQADAQAKARYAQQLKAFSDGLAPQMPDPALAHQDPATYIALKAQYDADKAHHDQFVEQVTALQSEAESGISQAEIAERDRHLLALPEIQNEETRNGFFEKAIGAAEALGLEKTALNRATGPEWEKLRTIHDWKDKADKYDAAMSRQMQRVRDGKRQTSTKPNAAQPTSSGERGLQKAKERLSQTGDLRDAAAAIGRLG